MTTQAELFDKAQECEEMALRTSEPQTVAAYAKVRDMWIKLANSSSSMTPDVLAFEIANITDLQSRIAAVNQK